MEPERYTQYLPVDLTNELALRLPWRDLYESYIHLPEFRRYDDPQHRLWRELYRRDLSSYPLPVGADIRQQYFWGRALVDGLDLSPEAIWETALTLVNLGYDIPLGKLITDKALTGPLPNSYPFYAAIRNGYMGIVKMLADAFSPRAWNNYITSAVESRSMDMLNYVLDRLTERGAPLVGYTLAPTATTGHANLFDRLFEYYSLIDTEQDYCYYLTYAVMSANTELASKMLNQCGPLDPPIISELLSEIEHITMLGLFLDMGLIGGLDDVDPSVIMKVGVNDCDLEFMRYAHSRGAVLTEDQYDTLVECTDQNIHEWIIDTMPQADYEIIMAGLVHRNSALFRMYLDSLTQPVDETHHAELYYEIFSALIEHNQVDLLEVMTNHPYMGMGSTVPSLDDHTFSLLLNSPRMLNFYLSLPPRDQELKLLKDIDLPNLVGVLSQRKYTDQELIALLSHRPSYPNDPRDITQRLTEAIPTHQREAVAKGLISYRTDMITAAPDQRLTLKDVYLTSLIRALRR